MEFFKIAVFCECKKVGDSVKMKKQEKARQKRNITTWVIVPVLFISAAAFLIFQPKFSNAGRGSTLTVDVQIGPIEQVVESVGTLKAEPSALLIWEIDGIPVIGYRIQNPDSMNTDSMNVWADAKTLLPFRIEILIQMLGEEGAIIMSDFKFNIDLDQSLFSLQVPEGYTHQETQMDMTNLNEEDLIEGLRVWAEMMGGVFPHTLNTTDTKNLKLWKKKLIETKLSEAEQLKRVMKVARCWLFIHSLKADSDWHYAGKDVKLGDADTAIFWYRPEGSETYRVIYGDLSVKDLAPDSLNKALEAPSSK